MNAYGPGQSIPAPWGDSKVRKIMPTFVAHALSDRPIPIYGDGTQVMDMVYVEDVAKVLVDALLAGPHPKGVTYEVGSGVATTVNDIAEEVLKATGSDAGVEHLPMRPGEPEHSVVLADLNAVDHLGWTDDMFVPLDVGVERTVKNIRRRI